MKAKPAHNIPDNKWYIKTGYAFEIKNRFDRILYRLLEILPGALSWSTIFLMIVCSYFYPSFVAIFIIIFGGYWVIKSVNFSIHLILSYKEIQRRIKIDWFKKLRDEFNDKYKNLTHLVVYPAYNETYELIRKSFTALIGQNYPLENFIVILATEESSDTEIALSAKKIKDEFSHYFKRLIITVHPQNLPNEIPGKGSNESWALKKAKEKIIDKEKIPYENVIVSVFDIDSRPYPDYFSILTYHFLKEKNPYRASYQPIPVFHNNVWQLPPFSRIVAFSTTYWQMMQQKLEKKLATFSSHSMSFKALIEMNFWQTNIVSEDSRIFWQSFLFYNGNYKVVPLFYPISMDACLGKNIKETAINQYKQQRRWAYGAENIPYLIFGFIKNKKIPLKQKLYYSLIQIVGFWSWSTSALILMFLGWLPLILGRGRFTETMLANNLPHITSTLMTLAMVGLVTSAIISTLLLPPTPRKFHWYNHIFLLLEWILIPVTVNVFGVLPSLDAQTRLMFGKYMSFWVTPKGEKENKKIACLPL